MPFTFSHPSVVLPLCFKKSPYLDVTALILGSMAPDFEYFIHFKPYQVHGHTLWGQFYFNLPLVFIVGWIFHRIIKEPLINNLPIRLSPDSCSILQREWQLLSLTRFLSVCLSSLLGMATHLFWDSFTHVTGYFVRMVPILTKSLNLWGLSIPVYKVLQHGSSLLGALAILLVLGYLMKAKTIMPPGSKWYKDLDTQKFWLNTFCTAIVCWITLITCAYLTLGGLIVSTINCVLIGILCASLLERLRRLHNDHKML